MSTASSSLGILIISHGSPREEANQRFTTLVERIAARLGVHHVLPTFFSIVRPSIPDRIAELAGLGVRRVLLMPYFLYEGQHVSKDIPELLTQCQNQFPDMTFQVLPTLESDPILEDLVVDRLMSLLPPGEPFLGTGVAIERQSFEIIDRQMSHWPEKDQAVRAILRRVIHATADLTFARSLRIHPGAVQAFQTARAAGKPIVCDVKMLQAGITRVDQEVLCWIGEEETTARARQQGWTRAAAAMDRLGPRLEGAVVAIGNAPTALWKVLEMASAGGPRPALVVGLPIGFVGAREAKLALLGSGLCHITNTTNRGGSPAAAAVINALALWQGEEG